IVPTLNREAEVFGETVDDVYTFGVFIAARFQNLGDACELVGGENGTGIDFVGYEMDVLRVTKSRMSSIVDRWIVAPSGFDGL
ncbi:hypothetical protein Csa_023498, partial [Cucumis sativus]